MKGRVAVYLTHASHTVRRGAAPSLCHTDSTIRVPFTSQACLVSSALAGDPALGQTWREGIF